MTHLQFPTFFRVNVICRDLEKVALSCQTSSIATHKDKAIMIILVVLKIIPFIIVVPFFNRILQVKFKSLTPSSSEESFHSQQEDQQQEINLQLPISHLVELLNKNEFQFQSNPEITVPFFLEHFRSTQTVQVITCSYGKVPSKKVQFELPSKVSIRTFLKSCDSGEKDIPKMLKRMSDTNGEFWRHPNNYHVVSYPFSKVKDFFETHFTEHDGKLYKRSETFYKFGVWFQFYVWSDNYFVYAEKPLDELIDEAKSSVDQRLYDLSNEYINAILAALLPNLNHASEGIKISTAELIQALVNSSYPFKKNPKPKPHISKEEAKYYALYVKHLKALSQKTFVDISLPYSLDDERIVDYLNYFVAYKKLNQPITKENLLRDFCSNFFLDYKLKTAVCKDISVEELVQDLNEILKKPVYAEFTAEQIKQLKNDSISISNDIVTFDVSLGEFSKYRISCIEDYLDKRLQEIPKIWTISDSNEFANKVISALFPANERPNELKRKSYSRRSELSQNEMEFDLTEIDRQD